MVRKLAHGRRSPSVRCCFFISYWFSLQTWRRRYDPPNLDSGRFVMVAHRSTAGGQRAGAFLPCFFSESLHFPFVNAGT